MGDRHYFSNNTEGDLWRHLWCSRCIHDHDFSHLPEGQETGHGCELCLSMVLGVDEPELVDTDWVAAGKLPPAHLVCLRFEACEDDHPRAVELRTEYLALPRKTPGT